MGEPEQLLAELDEVEEEVDANLEDLHPPSLNQQTPWLISRVLSAVLTLVMASGWYVLVMVVLGYFVWLQIEPLFTRWLKRREEQREEAEHHKNPDKLLAKHRALDEARKKMQEKYNIAAQNTVAKRKMQEESKAEENLAKLESMRQREGYTLRESERSTAATASTSTAKPSGKAKLRPEYNPLTGDTGGGSCSWRPSRRGASGGG